jgi:hypothetical protein
MVVVGTERGPVSELLVVSDYASLAEALCSVLNEVKGDATLQVTPKSA